MNTHLLARAQKKGTFWANNSRPTTNGPRTAFLEIFPGYGRIQQIVKFRFNILTRSRFRDYNFYRSFFLQFLRIWKLLEKIPFIFLEYFQYYEKNAKKSVLCQLYSGLSGFFSPIAIFSSFPLTGIVYI